MASRFDPDYDTTARKGDVGHFIDLGPATLADEKAADPDAPGSASDYAGTATDAIRRAVRRYRGPNAGTDS